jgi:DNA-binding XRE family transcriptional regulator
MDQQDTSKMIRQIRAAFGLTQEQFAAKVGVTYSTKITKEIKAK